MVKGMRIGGIVGYWEGLKDSKQSFRKTSDEIR